MTHRTDPDRRYIDAGIARLEAVANTPDPHANRLEQLQHELIAAADRRRELVAAIAGARRARRALIGAAVASARSWSLSPSRSTPPGTSSDDRMIP
jgi:hypothetical protein